MGSAEEVVEGLQDCEGEENEPGNMVEYAKRIRSLQRELGVSQAKFPDLNLD